MILARRMTIVGLIAAVFAMLFSMAVENGSRRGFVHQAGTSTSCIFSDDIGCRPVIR
ncbi:hypothetical protein [Rhizobium sp. NRK18]|jgi:hypothetical protein|uniref:hypothetical protein n=1 Tax=Rhizobium sp. NRK18 TaxID=2964667 RepID=UPI0021C4AD9F|nr:hypothetical protein [Rhizobium sp. NRK18]MCQ2004826.1 hypothetical protein [Rhizobium sp. NRK18]